jgi:hypothetical protein
VPSVGVPVPAVPGAIVRYCCSGPSSPTRSFRIDCLPPSAPTLRAVSVTTLLATDAMTGNDSWRPNLK